MEAVSQEFSRQMVKSSIFEGIEFVWMLTEADCYAEILGGLNDML
jgi:hypothetical protein